MAGQHFIEGNGDRGKELIVLSPGDLFDLDPSRKRGVHVFDVSQQIEPIGLVPGDSGSLIDGQHLKECVNAGLAQLVPEPHDFVLLVGLVADGLRHGRGELYFQALAGRIREGHVEAVVPAVATPKVDDLAWFVAPRSEGVQGAEDSCAVAGFR